MDFKFGARGGLTEFVRERETSTAAARDGGEVSTEQTCLMNELEKNSTLKSSLLDASNRPHQQKVNPSIVKKKYSPESLLLPSQKPKDPSHFSL